MKIIKLILAFVLINFCLYSQSYPLQDTRLNEDERIRNLISLLNTEEKVNCLSPWIAIPRLGIKDRTVEGLHGLAYSGPANWAVIRYTGKLHH